MTDQAACGQSHLFNIQQRAQASSPPHVVAEDANLPSGRKIAAASINTRQAPRRQQTNSSDQIETTNFQKQKLNYSNSNIHNSTQTSPSLNKILYHSHLLPLPLIGPNFLLASSSSSALAAATSSSSAPAASNGAGQFALTPDARACVTATYLCVLIVNNAWLDCNLLEMLCNNSTGGHSPHGPKNDSTNKRNGRDGDDEDELNLMRLNSLESAVNKLVAFAGGGEVTEDSDFASGRGAGPKLNDYVSGEQSAASYYFASPPVHLHLEPGETKSGIKARARVSANLLEQPSPPDQPSERPPLYHSDRQQLVNRLTSGEDEGSSGDKEQRKSQRAASGSSFRSISYPEQEQQSATTQEPGTLPATISAPATSTTGGQSLVSWVGRPFRGWSFWASNPSELEMSPVEQQTNRQQQIIVSHQILRPIDNSKSENNNDIQTGNQSALKGSALNVDQPRQYQQQDSALSGVLVTPTLEDYLSLAGSPLTGTDQSDMFLGSASSTNRRQQQRPSQSVTFGLVRQQPQLFEQSGECKCSNQDGNQDASPVSVASSIAGVSGIGGECRFRCSSSAAASLNNNQGPAQAGGQQQHQSTTPIMIVDSTQLISSGSSSYGQQAAGVSVSPAQSTSLVTTPSGVLMSSVIPATASTILGPTTTSGPSAKMNPLDVTFLLFTRYHREHAGKGVTGIGSGAVNGASQYGASAQMPLAVSSTSSNEVSVCELIDLTNETNLNESHLNSSLPIKIIIHGFGSGGRRPWVTDMVYKLLDYEDVNVIVVDWEKGATLPNYVQAAGNTRLVGHKIASLIKSINSKYGLTGNSYHLIGFSLGAHVAGFAGMEIRNSTSVSRLWINRITGLDPASPLFEGYEASDRLDPSDAQFVDVIHSNGDGVLRGGFGSLQPMGHVDFYPNGGRVQVGCNSVLLSALSDIIYGKWQSLCNHRRALNFFMDSFEFNKCRFRSFNCDSYENYLKGECFDCGQDKEKCSYMGYLANYSKGRGKMYLTTHEDAPFCANQFIIKIVGTKGYKTHWGKVEVTLVTLDGKNESFLLSSMNQQSNHHGGHDHHGNGQKDSAQHSMQSLIVAHPTLIDFTQVLLRYTKYKGWIYSGDESWSIDKVFITDSDGQVKSFCGYNTILESHITTRLSLEPGNCTVIEAQSTQPTSAATNQGQAQQQQVNRMGQQQLLSQQQQSSSPPPNVSSPSSTPISTSIASPASNTPQGQHSSARTPRFFSQMIQQHRGGAQAAELQVAAAVVAPHLLAGHAGAHTLHDRYYGNGINLRAHQLYNNQKAQPFFVQQSKHENQHFVLTPQSGTEPVMAF